MNLQFYLSNHPYACLMLLFQIDQNGIYFIVHFRMFILDVIDFFSFNVWFVCSALYLAMLICITFFTIKTN